MYDDFHNVTHWPKHVLVRYHFNKESDIDFDKGLYVLLICGKWLLLQSKVHYKLLLCVQGISVHMPGVEALLHVNAVKMPHSVQVYAACSLSWVLAAEFSHNICIVAGLCVTVMLSINNLVGVHHKLAQLMKEVIAEHSDMSNAPAYMPMKRGAHVE